MDHSEQLEISFLPQPLRISASLISRTGQEISQSCFDASNCPVQWISVLKAMAAATRSVQPDSSSPPQHAPQKTPSPGRQRGLGSCKRVGPGATDNGTSDSSTRPSRVLLPTTSTPAAFCGLASHPSSAPSSPRDRLRTPVPPAVLETRHADRPFNDDASTATNAAAALNVQQRSQRLEARLQAISDCPNPSKDDFNDTIRRLYIDSVNTSTKHVDSKEDFARVLGRLGSIASVQGIIYSLLSWYIFVAKEESLIHNEGQAAPVAAKRVCTLLLLTFALC